MRRLADADRIRAFMRGLASEARSAARVYFTGGATAVLLGWRSSTIDIDILVVPESDALLRALPRLKESLEINVELASPADFIPELPGWSERSLFIAQEGRLAFHHYDLYAQLLAKIERGHSRDVLDVREMLGRGLVDAALAREHFERIEPQLYRYPSIDPRAFRAAVEAALGPSPPA
jgi:hypothetical protein